MLTGSSYMNMWFPNFQWPALTILVFIFNSLCDVSPINSFANFSISLKSINFTTFIYIFMLFIYYICLKCLSFYSSTVYESCSVMSSLKCPPGGWDSSSGTLHTRQVLVLPNHTPRTTKVLPCKTPLPSLGQHSIKILLLPLSIKDFIGREMSISHDLADSTQKLPT